MDSYKVIDGFLNEFEYLIVEYCLNNIDWYWSDSQCEKDSFYFYHNFLTHKEVCPKFEQLKMFETKLGVSQWLNVRANLNVKSNTYNEPHKDVYDTKPHKTAVYYLNDNNGCLKLCNKTVECKKNRMVLMTSEIEHQAVHQTDVPKRIVLNFNYK